MNKKSESIFNKTKWIAVVISLLAIFMLMRKLPLNVLVNELGTFIDGFGIWGILIYALIYAVATVFLIPGTALTFASAPLFGGVGWGLVAVSIGSTLGAAFSFLIARFGARKKVESMIMGNKKFAAVDAAIAEGGWKVVALLRLSPVVPFNLLNYLLGLTRIHFWTCTLTSWLFMLPGTWMFVYIGYSAFEIAKSASGAGRQKEPLEWVLMAVGLLATIVVTVYITKKAGQALKKHATLEKEEESKTDSKGEQSSASPLGAIIASGLALILLSATAYAYFVNGKFLNILPVPPQVSASEKYEVKPNGPKIDHVIFDELLKAFVDDAGWVDYQGLGKKSETLDQYLEQLSKVEVDELGRNERLALLINAYNAFTLKLILENYPIDSIQSIPPEKRWDAVRWKVGKYTWSLNQIEHEQIRPHFKEHRIHFALVCAAESCPKLRNEAYTGERLEVQLADQEAYTLSNKRWYIFDEGTSTLYLTKLYSWYAGDFPSLPVAAKNARQIKYLPYSWKLNDKKNAESE